MAYSEDDIALAAEYALGTLDAEERAQVESMMAVDTEFTAIVRGWEYRLGSLNQMVGAVEPRPIVWENIQAAIGHSAEPQAPLVLPEAPPPPPPLAPAEPFIAEDAPLREVPIVDDTHVIYLAGRVRRWRNLASVASAIAAALVAMLGLQIYQPDLLPSGLRPKPRTQIVEVKTPTPAPAASPGSSSRCCSRAALAPRSGCRRPPAAIDRTAWWRQKHFALSTPVQPPRVLSARPAGSGNRRSVRLASPLSSCDRSAFLAGVSASDASGGL